jgi:hypothetical protein
MTATKQEETKKEVTDLPAEPIKPEVMGVPRDDKNARVSFTTDGNMMIITLPIGNMPRVMAYGFIYELFDMVGKWYAERAAIRQKLSLDNRDAVSKFNMKAGLAKLFKK